LIGARLDQDIPDFRFPDSSVYKAADRICEEISRKQAICSDETLLTGVVSASHDHNAGHIATDEPEIRLVNGIDFSIAAAAVTSQLSGADSSTEDVPPPVPVTQSSLALPSPKIKSDPDEIVIISSPERAKSPPSVPSIDSLQREVRHLRRQHLSDLHQLKFLADIVAALDNETQRQPTSAERAARHALLAQVDWPRHLSGVDSTTFAAMGSRLADVYGAQLHQCRYQF